MTSLFINLPTELHLLVFAGLSDLDDALSLSRTCGHFLMLYTSRKRDITRQIILSSDVYEYDFCLSRFLAADTDLAERYRRLGSDLPATERPEEAIFLDCMNSPRLDKTFTDESVEEIALRWQRSRVLRDCYQDDKVYTEYVRFRTALMSAPTASDTWSISEPGCTLPSSRQQRTARYGAVFNARFHKALCLHSIAIASHRLARATNRPVIGSKPDIEQLALDFWDKTSIVVGGKETTLTIQEKVDCLEVFDFLHMLVLRRLLPGSEYGFLDQGQDRGAETMAFVAQQSLPTPLHLSPLSSASRVGRPAVLPSIEASGRFSSR